MCRLDLIRDQATCQARSHLEREPDVEMRGERDKRVRRARERDIKTRECIIGGGGGDHERGRHDGQTVVVQPSLKYPSTCKHCTHVCLNMSECESICAYIWTCDVMGSNQRVKNNGATLPSAAQPTRVRQSRDSRGRWLVLIRVLTHPWLHTAYVRTMASTNKNGVMT